MPTEQGASVPPCVVGERQAVTALHHPALTTQALSHIRSNPGSARDVLCREGSGTRIRSQTMGPLLPEGLPSAPLGTQGGQSPPSRPFISGDNCWMPSPGWVQGEQWKLL